MRRTSLMLLFGLLSTLALQAAPNRWSGKGPGVAQVTRLISDPSNASVIYALRQDAGIYRSVDDGKDWQRVPFDLPASAVRALEVTGEGELFAAADGTVYRSADRGAHWTIGGTVQGQFVNALAYDGNSRTLYAGTPYGVFVSSDDGMTWTQANMRPPAPFILSLAVTRAGTVLASVQPPGAQRGCVIRSSDRGSTWSTSTCALTIGALGVDSASDIYIVTDKGVSVSSDEGSSWTNVASLPGGVVPLLLLVSGSRVYAATASQIFLYLPANGLWTAAGPAIQSGPPNALAVTSDGLFVVSTPAGGVLVDGGTTWSAVTDPFAGVPSYDVAAAAPDVACAAASSGFFRTGDGGATWSGSPTPQATSVRTDPRNSSVVYATASNGLFQSLDAGVTWSQIAPNFASAVAVSSSGSTLYAALWDSMYKTTDSGRTWQWIGNGLEDSYYFFYYGPTASDYGPTASSVLEIDPADDSTVYLATQEGLYRTGNGGKNWTIPLSEVIQALAIAPHETVVYAARESAGILKSEDAGANWSSGGLVDKRVRSLFISGNVVYAGTADGLVYRSPDEGATWFGVDAGLDGAAVSAISGAPGGSVLYAATSTGVREFAPQTISADVLAPDGQRLPRLISAGSSTPAALVIPVAGTVAGSDGTLYTTALSLVNSRSSPQKVIVSWLPETGAASSFHLLLPGSADGGVLTIPDIGETFAISGLGSLAVIAVDANDAIDAGAVLGAETEIWTHPADGRAPFAQSVTATSIAGNRSNADLTGPEQDSAFRSNVGVVNLSAAAHQYTLELEGERQTSSATLTVGPFSVAQIPLPAGDFGALTVQITADAPSAWVAYSSTIDRATGASRIQTAQ